MRYWKIVSCVLCLSLIFSTQALSLEDRHLKARLLWESDLEADALYRSISTVLQTSTGEFIVLDKRSMVINKYSADGEYLDYVEIRGEGPGEISSATGITIDESDNIFLLSAMGPVVVNLQAKWDVSLRSRAEMWHINGVESSGFGLAAGQDDLLVVSFTAYRSDNEILFQTISKDSFEEGKVIVSFPSLMSASRENSERDYYFKNYRSWCVSAEGELFVPRAWSSEGNSYNIDVYSLDGTHQRTLQKERVRKKRSEKDVRETEEYLLGGAEMVRIAREEYGKAPFNMEEYPPDVLSLFEQGAEIWVRTPYDEREGAFRVYDVFSKSGEEIGQVELDCEECNPKKDQVYLFGNRMIVVKGMYDKQFIQQAADADELQLLCFKLEGEEHETP